MDGALRSPIVSGREAQEDLPTEKPKKWPKSYSHFGCYINHGGEAFKREHMIIKDSDRAQVDEKISLGELEEGRGVTTEVQM